MKQIQKGNECQAVTDWRTENATVPQNLVYGRGGFPVEKVLEALLAEQGHLCAYTLKRIDLKAAHIEHLKPQRTCRAEDAQRELANVALSREDVAWYNLVACFPAPNSPAPPGYGAVKKDKWWPDAGAAGFVSPLDADCETRFSFGLNGEIAPANAADLAAGETIKAIGLDDSRLMELRKRAILEMGLHPRSPQPLKSPAKVRQLIAAWPYRDGSGKYREFCVPLRAAALSHLAKLEGRANVGAA
ncbi:hypothetical protein [Paucibacter sp. XJ19-41]|uniref:hypothetical protein n=1 Tax=Paucibacter sp. XJ19-41 TaxID=2927824 RepID=UPI0023496E4A|nr:hypothetical protein [Paucibacter sp. XJ19-41]MDC6167283.1 hypothetical protein [Paucibacter sp. XJ19-41]